MSTEQNQTPVEEVIETVPTETKSKKSIFHNRKFRYGTTATVLTIVVIIAAIFINIIFGVLDTKFPLKWDLTNDKLLTLSKESKEYAKAIKDDITITICTEETAFTAPNTGYEELDSVVSQFYSALQQYKSLSKGKVTFSFVDLTTDITKSAELSQYNVSAGSILYQSGKRYAVSAIADLYSYDENYETYMAYKNYGQQYDGEYSFNSLVERSLMMNINKITGVALNPITMLTGHGEDEDTVSALTEFFTNNGYEVLTLDITTMDNFDEKTDVAVIPAPTSDYTAEELKVLRSWVDNNGKRGHQLMYVANFSTYLPELSEYFKDNYGIEVTPNWIVETSSARMFSMYAQYIYGDVVDTEYTTKDDKWVKSPCTFQLKTNWVDNEQEAKYNKAIVTFPDTTEIIDVNAYKKHEEASQNGEKVELDRQKADSYPITGMAYAVNMKTVDGKAAYSNALVCGSNLYFSQNLNDGATSNEATFLSVFNGITGKEQAVNVATKSLATANVDFGSEATKKAVGLGLFTIGLPLCLLIAAFVIFLRRKNL